MSVGQVRITKTQLFVHGASGSDGRETDATTASCGILVPDNRLARELPPRHDRGRADDSHAATAGVPPSRAGSLPWRAAAPLRAATRAGTVPASPPDPAISAGPGAIHQGRTARPAPATPTRLTPRRRGRADVTDERLADQRVRARGSRDRRLTARHGCHDLERRRRASETGPP
jgi:hypothetical protein